MVIKMDEEEAFVRLHRERRYLAALAGGMLSLVFLASLVVARSTSQPITRLTDVVRSVAKGNLDQTVLVSGYAEIAELSGAFNKMTADLRNLYSGIKKLSSAVEQTADVVFITDRTGVIEYVNPAFELTTGFAPVEALGRTPRILKSGQMPPEYYQQLWETILAGQAFRAQTVNRNRDGALIVADQTITPMKDHEGRITHFVSVLKDMTERIRLQERAIEHRLAGSVQQHLFPARPPQLAG